MKASLSGRPALAYLLAAIAKQHLHLNPTLWEILQVVRVALVKQVPLPELFNVFYTREYVFGTPNQLEIKYS